jgi:hypothetical protein
VFVKLGMVVILLAALPAFAQDDACADVVQQSYETTQEVCDGTQGEEACYGNVSVSAQPEDLDFDNVGDVVGLADLEGLRLSTMDTDAGEWGISLMRVEANLSDEEAVAAVDVVLFGNVEIANAADESADLAPMQAFVFQSGVEDRLCDEAPDSGILIQTPQGVGEITFLVNEASIELGSTAYLQAEPGGEMAVSVVDGDASVSAQGVTIETPAGSQTTIPLDEDGLADGPPEGPEPYDESVLLSLPVVLLSEEITIAFRNGGASQLIDGTWQGTLIENTCNAPLREVTTDEAAYVFEGDSLTTSAGGFTNNYTLLETGIYVLEADASTARLEILAPDHYIFTSTVSAPAECIISFDFVLIE